MAEIPENLGNLHKIKPVHIAAQLRGIGGFADQIKLVVQIVVELGHHLQRLQALAVAGELFHPAGHHAHQRHILVDHRQHARAQHLHGHIALVAIAVADHCEVHLRNRRAGHRLALERHEHLIDGLAEGSLDGLHRHLRVKRRHAVLQQRQFVRNIGRHQVAPRGQHLAELHEDRAQTLQRLTQALAARGVQLAAERGEARNPAEHRILKTVQNQLIQPVAQAGPDNVEAARKPTHGAQTSPREKGMEPTKLRSACTTFFATDPMAWAGASPMMRARSSSTSQRTLSTSQLISAANFTSPSMRMVGRSPRMAPCAIENGEVSTTSMRRSGVVDAEARSSSPAGVICSAIE
ncbi:hypothetical protein SDC9_116298 [bioreactor metagenome]|uniref:Uncharacterized protein n=1 Tax=bioreactor metagenome TaxID=1076179 RepID=A0A645C1X8_9ZZZZ